MSNTNKQDSRPLDPEEFLKDKELGKFDKRSRIKCMNEYAAYRTVFSHNQLLTKYKEERQTALELLAQCDAYQLPEWLADKIQAFFHQLNKSNEQ